jgi:hypothetical protein
VCRNRILGDILSGLRLYQGIASLGLKTDKSGDAHRHAQQLDCGDRG